MLLREVETFVIDEGWFDSFAGSPSAGRDIGAQSTFSLDFGETKDMSGCVPSFCRAIRARRTLFGRQTSHPARERQQYPTPLLVSLEERPRESVREVRGPKSWV